MNWKLTRPKPALPNSYFWTWDHSTNWMLDDPGLITYGCADKYMKRPETYIEDYKRLTDLSADIGIKGIVIWGFLRDSHGGIEYARKVAAYAASKGVAIMPGVGIGWYGGVYYEGDHPYNAETFLKNNPSARGKDENGNAFKRENPCPTNPVFLDWLHESMQWLFKEFEIGGVNIEYGDIDEVCQCPKCRESKKMWPENEPDVMRMQALGTIAAFEAVKDKFAGNLVTAATYTGFCPGKTSFMEEPIKYFNDPQMMCENPVMLERMPQDGILQWTCTNMVFKKPLPLIAYLENGAPKEAFDNKSWPTGIVPGNKHSVALLHQGSQWFGQRYLQILSTIKEACLHAYRSGLEGISISGEVTLMHVPVALNYLAFSHFTHWPEDSMLDFGRKTLGEFFGSEEDGETFIRILAAWDAGIVTESQRSEARKHSDDARGVFNSVGRFDAEDMEKRRWWWWLYCMCCGYHEKETTSFF